MHSPARSANGLLASLSAEDFEAIRPHLKTVEHSQDRSLIELGEAVNDVYLPHGGVILLIVVFETGEWVEVAMVGRDSILGVPIAATNAVRISAAAGCARVVRRLLPRARYAAQYRQAWRDRIQEDRKSVV